MIRIFMNAGESVAVDNTLEDIRKQLSNLDGNASLQFLTFTKENVMINLNQVNFIKEEEEEEEQNGNI